MGISNDISENRRRRNVITLSGQFFSFVLETIYMIIYLFLIEFDIVIYINVIHASFTALLTFTFFLSSPELRRFYFMKSNVPTRNVCITSKSMYFNHGNWIGWLWNGSRNLLGSQVVIPVFYIHENFFNDHFYNWKKINAWKTFLKLYHELI